MRLFVHYYTNSCHINYHLSHIMLILILLYKFLFLWIEHFSQRIYYCSKKLEQDIKIQRPIHFYTNPTVYPCSIFIISRRVLLANNGDLNNTFCFYNQLQATITSIHIKRKIQLCPTMAKWWSLVLLKANNF